MNESSDDGDETSESSDITYDTAVIKHIRELLARKQNQWRNGKAG